MNNRNRAVLWVLAVFLLGALAGGTLVYLFVAPAVAPAEARQGQHPRPSHEEAMKKLSEDLGLNAAQAVEIARIFEESRTESRQAFRQIRERSHLRIKEILTPDQMRKFEELTRSFRERRGWEKGKD